MSVLPNHKTLESLVLACGESFGDLHAIGQDDAAIRTGHWVE